MCHVKRARSPGHENQTVLVVDSHPSVSDSPARRGSVPTDVAEQLAPRREVPFRTMVAPTL